MRIVIAGGTGFLGSPLAEVWAEDGHDVRVLTRSLPPGEARHDPGTGVPGITRVGWKPDGQGGPWARTLDGADAVINLSGEGISDRRWTPQRKAQLRDSRILPTRSIVAAIKAATVPPRVLISGSAVGYYGASGDEPKTEESPAGRDFLAHVCEEWEREAFRAAGTATRVVTARTGVVLERSGGALPQMMRPFRFFAGGRIGSGRQYVSWIHRHDWIEMMRWIVQTARRQRSPQCDCPCALEEPRVRTRARPGHAAAGVRACAGICAQTGARRNGRRRADGPVRDPRTGTGARLSLPLPGHRPGFQGDLRRVRDAASRPV